MPGVNSLYETLTPPSTGFHTVGDITLSVIFKAFRSRIMHFQVLITHQGGYFFHFKKTNL
jgi:hypothetical protein